MESIIAGTEIVFDSSEIQIHRKLKDGMWQTFIVTFKFHPRKGKFPLGWNGSRFAVSTEYDRFNKFSPETLRLVEVFLRENFSNDKNERKLIVQNRQILNLVHFTNERNLESIINHGLCARDSFEHKNIHPVVNDLIRLDDCLNAISLSISFPNSKMFYKYRATNPGESWVVLTISPSILFEMNCAFCKHNAADARIRSKNKADLSNSKSLHEMFDEIVGADSRMSQDLKECDPTDVQAEVLTFGTIDPSKITGFIFNKLEIKKKYENFLTGKKLIVHRDNQGYFSDRTHYRNKIGS